MLQPGDRAPPFELPDADLEVVALEQFIGRCAVVLYFYPKDDTPGCTIEVHNIQRDLAKYEQNRAVIEGVSVDSTGSHQ